jgi:hypothetical protein
MAEKILEGISGFLRRCFFALKGLAQGETEQIPAEHA